MTSPPSRLPDFSAPPFAIFEAEPPEIDKITMNASDFDFNSAIPTFPSQHSLTSSTSSAVYHSFLGGSATTITTTTARGVAPLTASDLFEATHSILGAITVSRTEVHSEGLRDVSLQSSVVGLMSPTAITMPTTVNATTSSSLKTQPFVARDGGSAWDNDDAYSEEDDGEGVDPQLFRLRWRMPGMFWGVPKATTIGMDAGGSASISKWDNVDEDDFADEFDGLIQNQVQLR
ncbi:hypothetical protein HK096_001046 [Nowakowskiella sp. JEL0078]|nr:hypothetical protein HK096_001046 [Nowakowskiella sp. JEL0078]